MAELAQTAIHLSKACRSIIPAFYGQRVSPQTAMRWVNKGLLAADGTVVRLKAFRAGRQLVTSEEWVAEFFDELTRRSGIPGQLESASLKAQADSLYGAGSD